VRVRRALNYCTNREGLVTLLNGLAEPAAGVYHKTDPYVGHPKVQYTYDPAKAKALLKEAGWGPDKPIAAKVMISTSGSGQMLPLPMNEYLQQKSARRRYLVFVYEPRKLPRVLSPEEVLCLLDGLFASTNRTETMEAVRKLLDLAPSPVEQTNGTDPGQQADRIATGRLIVGTRSNRRGDAHARLFRRTKRQAPNARGVRPKLACAPTWFLTETDHSRTGILWDVEPVFRYFVHGTYYEKRRDC
jgi:Bacterial extracellular solute-binding proteins, family 5 Middle